MDREQQVERVEDLIHRHYYGSMTDHMPYHSCACTQQAEVLVDVARILAEANGFEVDIEVLAETYLNPRIHIVDPLITSRRTGCGCSGHWMLGVRHIVACCDQPHIDQMMFSSVVTSEGIQSYSDVVNGSQGMVCYCDTITGGALVRKETCPIHGEAVRQALSLTPPKNDNRCTCSAYEVAEDCLIHGSHHG